MIYLDDIFAIKYIDIPINIIPIKFIPIIYAFIGIFNMPAM